VPVTFLRLPYVALEFLIYSSSSANIKPHQALFTAWGNRPDFIKMKTLVRQNTDICVLLQWAFAVPVTLLRLPYSFVESLIWSAMLYWIIGFAPDAGR